MLHTMRRRWDLHSFTVLFRLQIVPELQKIISLHQMFITLGVVQPWPR
jgi:hypothetical protein